MRSGALSIFFILCSLGLKSQDVIISNIGDTIYCRITAEAKRRIYFTIDLPHGSPNESMLLANVRMYQKKGFFPVYPNAAQGSTSDPLRKRNKVSTWISAFGGYGFLSGEAPINMTQDQEDLLVGTRGGFHAGATFHIGIQHLRGGLIYERLSGMSTSLSSAYTSNGQPRYGEFANNITMTYWGIDLMASTGTEERRFAVFSSITGGYLTYRNQALTVDPVEVTANCLAWRFRIGICYRILKRIELGLEEVNTLAYVEHFLLDKTYGGQPTPLTFKDGNLSRWATSVLLSYRF